MGPTFLVVGWAWAWVGEGFEIETSQGSSSFAQDRLFTLLWANTKYGAAVPAVRAST